MAVPLGVQIGAAVLPSVISMFGGGGDKIEPLDFGTFFGDFTRTLREQGLMPDRFGLSDQELEFARGEQRRMGAGFDQGLTRGLNILRNQRRGSSAQAASLGLQAASMKSQRAQELTQRIVALDAQTRRAQQAEFAGLGISAYDAVSRNQMMSKQLELEREMKRQELLAGSLGSVGDIFAQVELLDALKKLGPIGGGFDTTADPTLFTPSGGTVGTGYAV